MDPNPIGPHEIDPKEKVKTFPEAPGIYLMKDGRGQVIYIGKAVNLRARAGSYFTKQAAEDPRTSDLVLFIRDVDFVQAYSEVDALLMEARLIKDIQPRFNSMLKDGKTFPYLQITTREQFPRVEVTRNPRPRGVKLYGPFVSPRKLRGALTVLQQIFRFRTCGLNIREEDPQWRWFRPCLLASIHQCTAPCNLRISREDYRRDIRRLIMFLDGKSAKLLAELRGEMTLAARELRFEKAARIRDQISLLETLNLRGNLKDHQQPEVFPIDPKKGVRGLQKVLNLSTPPRCIEGMDIAHLQGSDTVASLVQFIDGLPFKDGYKRYRIKSVQGIDDFASMREVVSRRFRHLQQEGLPFPDILLIDGGKGQLSAAMEAFRDLEITPPTVISLAKQDEEIFRPGESESIKLSRHAFSLRLLQYVRDESHRFAQNYHKLLRHRSTFEGDTD